MIIIGVLSMPSFLILSTRYRVGHESLLLEKSSNRAHRTIFRTRCVIVRWPFKAVYQHSNSSSGNNPRFTINTIAVKKMIETHPRNCCHDYPCRELKRWVIRIWGEHVPAMSLKFFIANNSVFKKKNHRWHTDERGYVKS